MLWLLATIMISSMLLEEQQVLHRRRQIPLRVLDQDVDLWQTKPIQISLPTAHVALRNSNHSMQ